MVSPLPDTVAVTKTVFSVSPYCNSSLERERVTVGDIFFIVTVNVPNSGSLYQSLSSPVSVQERVTVISSPGRAVAAVPLSALSKLTSSSPLSSSSMPSVIRRLLMVTSVVPL